MNIEEKIKLIDEKAKEKEHGLLKENISPPFEMTVSHPSEYPGYFDREDDRDASVYQDDTLNETDDEENQNTDTEKGTEFNTLEKTQENEKESIQYTLLDDTEYREFEDKMNRTLRAGPYLKAGRCGIVRMFPDPYSGPLRRPENTKVFISSIIASERQSESDFDFSI